MPESIEDGEKFGKGDTFFTTCLGKRPAKVDYSAPPEQQMINLEAAQR